jgi:hypothetical protein
MLIINFIMEKIRINFPPFLRIFICFHLLSLGMETENVFAQNLPEKLRSEIQKALLERNEEKTLKLWLEAKKPRGLELGKADIDFAYSKIDSSAIDLKEVENAWNQSLDQFMAWELNCPELPSETPLTLLGLCYAQAKKNQLVPKEKVNAVMQMLLEQQFTKEKVPERKDLVYGSFGLLVSPHPDSCGFSGPLQKSILSTAKKYPEWKVLYNVGPFGGRNFLVADQGPGAEKMEAWMGNQMYWVVKELLFYNQVFPDSAVRKAAFLAGNWLEKEEPVPNFHQNARIIAALALLYAESGKVEWKNRLIWLLKSSLEPGQLQDENADGSVDGLEIPFDSLVANARKPGRFFDAQNSSPWNTAICADGFLQAYLAFLKRADTAEARKWKKNAKISLENLCEEICQFGLPPTGTGLRDLAQVVFEALIFWDKSDTDFRKKLEKSARIIWNSGYLKDGKLFALNQGQLMCWLEEEK